MTDNGTVIEGRQNVEMASWLALRSALSLQIKTGMKMSRGQSASAIAIHRLQAIGLVKQGKKPQARACYTIIDKMLTDTLGPDFAKPL